MVDEGGEVAVGEAGGDEGFGVKNICGGVDVVEGETAEFDAGNVAAVARQ